MLDGVPQPPTLRRLCRFVMMCVGGLVAIRDVHSREIPLVPNDTQTIVLAAMMDQAAQEKPVRIAILKSRKTGISTLIQAIFADICCEAEHQIAKTLAHQTDATQEIFDIAKRASRGHESVDPQVRRILWPNGSWYACYTAAGQAVGAGGTPSMVHCSEGPKWAMNKVTTEYNVAISVPDVPETIIIYEFTAVGRELFYKKFEDAHRPDHPWEPIFLPWYLDSRCNASGAIDERDEYEEGLIDSALKTYRHSVSDGQLLWRRGKIIEHGPEIFRQEYPSTPAEAVQATAGLIFPHARNCIVDEVPFNPYQVVPSEQVGGIDFGYHHPTVIVSGVYRDDVLTITKLYRESKALAEDHVIGLISESRYWCDPAEAKARHELIKAADGKHCRFMAAPRRRIPGEGIGAAEMRMVLRMMRDGKLKILESAAEQFVLECDNLMWNEKTGQPDDSSMVPGCGHFDTIYAVKYLVMGLMAKFAPIHLETTRKKSRREEMMAI